MMYLLYVSSAVHGITQDDILDILRASRRNNNPLGITGLLLYKGGNFIQLLEGPEDAVLKLHQKIATDPRHHAMRTLLSGKTEERLFGEWAMGFSNVDTIREKLSQEDLDGLSSFLQQPFDADEFINTPHRALRFLLNFKDLMR
ncbi:MAG: BLUF domain-containing protein [bacterium]|nr:BLUF domain-containing protein [bacterium]